ncbi:ester cyclase [Actinomadura violacea]|uniref:Ester cyclase n=1 Tax=Actinomadura violacea TaxID=2819934 RepID=A0ABS3S329_9ACTN|nr:ester cyclase [Actinomadura violacea]MBO2462640.1 ester cyclase [Actinomadura violacea]
MSPAENKDRCQKMVDAWNRGELEGVIVHWAPDIVHHSEGALVPNEEMIERMHSGLKAFPDVRLRIESMVAEGDRVSVRISVSATHSGPFMNIPPTGRRVTWLTAEEFRFSDGRVVEHWDVINYMPMLRELDMVESDVRGWGTAE